jgi:peptidyl-prolyl cis-trans isomerase C
VTVSVNGIEVRVEGAVSPEFAATRELLRQRASELGLISAEARKEDEIVAAIEALLEREVVTPEPTEAECLRYYEQNPAAFESGDLVHARHILFKVTPRVNVPEIRARAESTLNALLAAPERLTALAAELSNCPSGQQGGNLGQIGRGDTVPEFEKALFRFGPTGLLPELVKTRYGFHIVAVDQRIPGKKLPFDAVREDIAEFLRAAVEKRALHQYVRLLAGRADIVGANLEGSDAPLIQ